MRSSAPHSADTETSRRQFPYHPYRPRSTLYSSVQVNVSWKWIIFVTDLTIGFINGTFHVHVSNIKCLFSFDAGHSLVTHRNESSSTKFEIHTIKSFSCCSVVERRSAVHRHCFF
jgi:hypothetical protein